MLIPKPFSPFTKQSKRVKEAVSEWALLDEYERMKWQSFSAYLKHKEGKNGDK